MAVGIGAAGSIGVAEEVTAGTYVAPTKFFPIKSESLSVEQNTILRRVIRQTSDPIGAVQGDSNLSGDVSMEALADVIPYFMKAARVDLSKTGSGPYTYEYTPNSDPEPADTLSITIVRNGIVFGYTGCVIGSYEFMVEDGVLMMNLGILGRAEGVQSAPSETYANEGVIGAGSYDVRLPKAAGAPVATLDGFTFSVDDGASPQFRLNPTQTTPSYIVFGDRTVTMSANLDFDSRSDYDDYLAVTETDWQVTAVGPTNEQVLIEADAAIFTTYEVGLSGPGDIVQANIEYTCMHDDAAGYSYKLTVDCDEDVT